MGETGKQMPPCTELAYPGLRKLTGKTKELASGEAQEFRLSVAGARKPIVPFNLRV